MFATKKWLIAATLALVFSLVTQAPAVQYTFFNITNNGNTNVGGQLLVDVTANGSQVDFKFTNNVGVASSITDIYFDDGTLLGIASISGSGPGVAFMQPATPAELPGANGADPDFVTTDMFSADSDSPPAPNGVNSSSEWVTITFDLQGGQVFGDTIDALASGELRIGLHVQAIGTTGGSDSYVNDPTPVPVPAAAGLGALGLLVVGWARKRLA
ncbi:MAG TPA: hypothetical protein VGM03_05265 [Phycisphaerae bacterium]|jgi:hypothetical protein